MRELTESIRESVNHALSRAGSYLYGLCGDNLKGKIDKVRDFVGTDNGNAIVTGSSVFVVLYLAVAFALPGVFWWRIIWPWFLFEPELRRTITFILIAFAGVAYYVYRLKLRLLFELGKITNVDDKLAGWQEQVDRAENEAASRAEAAEETARAAIEARERAEKRLAEMEAAARPAAQPEKAPGPATDEKFTEARRTFARLYHPENLKPDISEAEKAVRADLFKEYWRELERIHKIDRK